MQRAWLVMTSTVVFALLGFLMAWCGWDFGGPPLSPGWPRTQLLMYRLLPLIGAGIGWYLSVVTIHQFAPPPKA